MPDEVAAITQKSQRLSQIPPVEPESAIIAAIVATEGAVYNICREYGTVVDLPARTWLKGVGKT